MKNSPEKDAVISQGTYYLDNTLDVPEIAVVDRSRDSLTEGDGFDHELPREAAIEHIDWMRLHSPDPAVLIVSGIHGDEFETAELFEQTQAEFLIPRTQLLRAHLAAVFMGTRGYEMAVPILNSLSIDLNRQFPFQGDERTWSEFVARVPYPEARLLLEFLSDNSQSEFLFTFHEDPDRNEDFYFYDSVFQDTDQATDSNFIDIRKEFLIELQKHGFTALNGYDDPEDPDLGLLAVDGYIFQPLIDKAGMRKTDNSFESAALDLGGNNLTNMQRVFTFEVPGQMTRVKKAELIKVIQQHFIIPYLATQGIES